MKICTMCSKEYDELAPQSEYAQAGEWLAGEVWKDAGKLCHLCLENRARLVMMYDHDHNS